MKTLLAMMVAVLLFGAGAWLAPALQPWLAFLNLPITMPSTSTLPHEEGGGAQAERKPIKYRHPMNPTIFSDTPAKDDMGMDYIPVLITYQFLITGQSG